MVSAEMEMSKKEWKSRKSGDKMGKQELNLNDKVWG